MAEILPWQDDLWQQLTGSGLRAHAWLLHGPAGIGKRDLVSRLIGWQLCTAPSPAGACGQCRSCHAIEANVTRVGPSLFGVVGREAGSVAGYTYSKAMIDSGLTWTPDTLDAWRVRWFHRQEAKEAGAV